VSLDPLKKGNNNNKHSISISRARKTNKTYRFYKKLGHLITPCFKYKIKKGREEKNKQPQQTIIVDFVESQSNGDVLLATNSEKRSYTEWFWILVVCIICVLIRLVFNK